MSEPTVFVVDDEEPVRDSITLLLRSVGLRSRGFPDAKSFLAGYPPDQPGCLLLDVRMPHMSGLELQQELERRGITLPTIFMTGHGDVPMAVEAMRSGAMDFLQKPFQDEELIRRVQKAVEQDAREREQLRHLDAIRKKADRLTAREREVARRVVAGQANKVIAAELEISERTVELHRARVMQKMEARSLAQLVRMMVALEKGAAARGDPDT